MATYDATEDGAPSEFMEQLKTPRGVVVTFSVFICVLGQFLQWTQTRDKWTVDKEAAQWYVNLFGAWALFLVIISALNMVSLVKKQPQLVWVTAALLFSVVDVNVCYADSVRRNNFNGTLLTSYILSLLGAFLSFVAVFPGTTVAPSISNLTGVAVAAVFSVLLVVGSVLLWSKGSPCMDYANPGANTEPKVIPAAAAVTLAVWYLTSTVTDYREGRELSLLLASGMIILYQPFGPSCDPKTCQAGASIITIVLACMVLWHVVMDSVAANLPPGNLVTRLYNNTKAYIAAACCCVALIGGIILWSVHHEIGWKDAEIFATVMMTLIPFMMLRVAIDKNVATALAALSLFGSLIQTVISGDDDSGIMQQQGSSVRIGYLFLFVGAFVSLLALPGEDSNPTVTKSLSEDRKPYMICALLIICSTIFLWSNAVYEGPVGFVGLVLAFVVVIDFQHGLHWVYFASIALVPSLTPFTVVNSDGADKLALLLCWTAFLAIIYLHLTKFGPSAFSELKFLLEWGDKQGDAEFARLSSQGGTSSGLQAPHASYGTTAKKQDAEDPAQGE